MRSRLMGAMMAFTVALASSAALAQNRKQAAFDPHDLSGYWDLTNVGLNETSNNRPPMTAWGLEKFHKTKTAFDAKSLGNGAVANEKEWNDPVRWCDPPGFPRILWGPNPPEMRFAQAAGEVIQFFGSNRVWRDIWMDGRKLPGDDADSRWYGYAVGHWEGDTFVVNSNNFTDTSWLDPYGSPHSDEMTVEERYRRVDHDHLELTLNITDPKTYVGTWKGDKKIFHLAEKPAGSEFNDLPENICAWSETRRPVNP